VEREKSTMLPNIKLLLPNTYPRKNVVAKHISVKSPCCCQTYSWGTGWRRCIGCLKLQVSFCKRATNRRALLQKETYTDKASYGSLPPCIYLVAKHVCWCQINLSFCVPGIYIFVKSPCCCQTYTEWRRLVGYLKLQVIFRKRATNYKALLRKMTNEDKASHDSTSPCMYATGNVCLESCTCFGNKIDTLTNYRSLLQKSHIKVVKHIPEGIYLVAKTCTWFQKYISSSVTRYGVATISRLLKMIGLFCRISSLL